MSRGIDSDLCASGTRSGSDTLNLLDDIHAFDNGAEDNVLAIEPAGLGSTKEDYKKVMKN